MTAYSWTLTSPAGTSSASGDVDALTRFVRGARLSGLMAADWVVDLLLADGFENGEAVHRHEGSDGWTLAVRPLGNSERH
ncbi:hypothetical protein OIU34_23845 [Pararhizobium sp. BT-229]|uniref:hypothetical protein n=1 Tax=Pararhizobium sp. BT-229 TaxID=2986923 RepID=UPI0021F798B2|nr:hypothetical protein [Pararhizobium sp. BT-229]MCV9964931.1 hypothetical protein [Pararhizobium sp. BT-229]